jgi:hypothetical protein
MTAPGVFTQYSTIEPWLGTAPGWIPTADSLRIRAYQKYEEIYWSSEEGFTQLLRGDNDNPVFMPTAKTLVNTVNRYTAPAFNWAVSAPEGVSEEAVTIAELAFENLFAREAFLSKFNSNKLQGLFRGDWLWHIIADDAKPLGRRIKIMPIDPAAYFPVYESDVREDGDPERIVKVHLAEPQMRDDQEVVSRMTYERIFDEAGNQTAIIRSHAIYKPDEWTATDARPIAVVLPPEPLPDIIPAIPVYHLKNVDPTAPFGSSELRGIESVLLGINQTISDEDAALALDGIGIYATDGGAPRDQSGNEVDWVFGPGRVLIHANNLRRVNGTSSVTPFGDHYNRLVSAVREAVGASDAAVGKIDASTAESGIALIMQLKPIIAHTAEKDQHIIDVHAQMFYDLCFWLAEYEELPLLMTGEGGQTIPLVTVTPVIGEKIPVNRKQIVDEIISLRSLVPAAISLATAHKMMREAGIPLEENELELILAEQEQLVANVNGERSDEEEDQRRAEEAEEEEANA